MQKLLIVKNFLCKYTQKRLVSSIVFAAILMSGMNVQAKVIGQNFLIDLNYENAKLSTVLNDIEKQTSCTFFYNHKDVDDSKKVDAKFRREKLNIVVSKIMGNNYKIEYNNNIVMIKKKILIDDDKKEKLISGKVIDEKCHPMPGVTVVVQGTSIGVATDSKGKYKIKAKKGDVLKFTFIGYKEQIILIKDQKNVNIKLVPLVEMLEETTVVAFGTQKKETVVSSVSTIKGEALESSNSDLTAALTGKLSGVIGWQVNGLPGALTEEEMGTKFYIRGITSFQSEANVDPLIILDGVEVSKLDLARIDPDDIESLSVMKDASATAMYGARGANGVICVETKKGKDGDVFVGFKAERIWSKATDIVDVVNPKRFMRMYNQAITERDPNAMPFYTKERIDRTNNPNYPSFLYPGNDWYGKMFEDYTFNNHYNLNVRGGRRRLQYYASISHNNNSGVIKTDGLNQFDCNITNKQTNFRVNLNVHLTDKAKLNINSFSTYDDYHGPIADASQVYSMAFNSSPVDFAMMYPLDKEHCWPHLAFGGNTYLSNNPYAQVQRGYKDRVRYSTINRAEYIQNLSSWIKGLELRAAVSLNKTALFSQGYSTVPFSYELENYNPETGEHKLRLQNLDHANSKLQKDNSASGSAASTTVQYQIKLMHNAAWKEKHQMSTLAVFEAKESSLSNARGLVESFPGRNVNFAFRANYGYKSKYFLESSFALNGSERFDNSNKIGFFPSVGCAWVVSKEDCMRQFDSWLYYLKLRLSYGFSGNDGVIKNPRFLYLESIGPGGNVTMGKADFVFHPYAIYNYPNTNTKWEIAEQTNFGLELKLFKGLLETNIDIYQEIRHNIYSYRSTLPSTMGLYSSPLDNVGKVRSRGIDVVFKFQKALGQDCYFILNNTLTYNRAKYLEIEEPQTKPWYQKKVGNDISQKYCYIAEGLFQSEEEIRNAPHQDGDTQPGDIRYKDINNDGIINIEDVTFVGHPQTPALVYGFNGLLHYKNFEFSFAFQGTSNRAFFIDPNAITPFMEERSLLKVIADDHWSSTNQKNNTFWPKLSTQEIGYHNPQEDSQYQSTYFMKNGRFIRCKSLQASCYIPESICKTLKIKKLKIFARANNPFVISSFKVWDVELGSNGFNYPIQKTYSLGLNLSF